MLMRLAWLSLLFSFASSLSAREPDFKLPPGFKITQFADEKLANDIYSMALDAKGRVHVSSQGWVKRLDDTDGDGIADQAPVILSTRSGAMGMLFDENYLYLSGSDGIVRFENLPNEESPHLPLLRKPLVKLSLGEHGAHAIRKGPDGKIYVIVGDNAGLNKLKFNNVKSSTEIEGGGIFSFHTEKNASIYNDSGLTLHSHGFRNPYDFDFTPYGDIITCDSDAERDFLLPWYVPTRLFHVAPNQHHGWLISASRRAIPRPEYYPDSVPYLQRMGRGSPTGMVCYRHTQFPEKYRGGVFTLDWTFGNVWFHSLTPNGTSYSVKTELFLQPTGQNGFAPTDVCVAPDGSLLVSIGGRGTRGSVYRIEYTIDGSSVMPKIPSDNPVIRIVDAVQPLEPWSRAQWLSKDLIEEWEYKRLRQFLDEGRGTELQRIRAIEALTEEISFRMDGRLQDALSDRSPLVRARVAWGLGYRPELPEYERLMRLAKDVDPRVRIAAVEALVARNQSYADAHRTTVYKLVADPDKRVQLATLSLLKTTEHSFHGFLYDSIEPLHRKVRWSLDLLAPVSKEVDTTDLIHYLPRLEEAQDPDEILQILRLAIRTFGDWCLTNPRAEVYTAYTLQNPPSDRSRTLKRFAGLLKKRFPSTDPRLNLEIPRFLAMIEDDDPATIPLLLQQITPESDPTQDVHYLIVLSQLRAQFGDNHTVQLADAILNLSGKLQGMQSRIKQNWDVRLGEVISQLLAKAPSLASELLTHPKFIHPAHVGYALLFEASWREQAARFFLAALKRDVEFEWSPRLIDLLGELPASESHRILRTQWNRGELRDSILIVLARNATEIDREWFLSGLDSPRKATRLACVKALANLAPDSTLANLVPVLRLLRRELHVGGDSEILAACVRLVNRQAKQSFEPIEVKTYPAKAYEAIFAWFAQADPKAYALLFDNNTEAVSQWKKALSSVKWENGKAERGAKLFQSRSCGNCHQHGSAIGPDLTGVAFRFSREDLFNAILYPDRDVVERSRLSQLELTNGTVVNGIVVFESADALIVQIDGVQTRRIPTSEIRGRRMTAKSPMPSGLLKDMKPEELADLYQYLRELKAP